MSHLTAIRYLKPVNSMTPEEMAEELEALRIGIREVQKRLKVLEESDLVSRFKGIEKRVKSGVLVTTHEIVAADITGDHGNV